MPPLSHEVLDLMATRSHEQEKTKAALVRSYPEHTQLATRQKTFLRTLLLTPLARRAAGKSCPSGLLSFPFSIMNPYHVTNHFVYFKTAAERDEFVQNVKMLKMKDFSSNNHQTTVKPNARILLWCLEKIP